MPGARALPLALACPGRAIMLASSCEDEPLATHLRSPLYFARAVSKCPFRPMTTHWTVRASNFHPIPHGGQTPTTRPEHDTGNGCRKCVCNGPHAVDSLRVSESMGHYCKAFWPADKSAHDASTSATKTESLGLLGDWFGHLVKNGGVHKHGR